MHQRFTENSVKTQSCKSECSVWPAVGLIKRKFNFVRKIASQKSPKTVSKEKNDGFFAAKYGFWEI